MDLISEASEDLNLVSFSKASEDSNVDLVSEVNNCEPLMDLVG